MTIKAQTKGLPRYADFEDYIKTKPSDFEIRWGVSAGDAQGKLGFESAMQEGLNAVQELTAFLSNVIQTLDAVVDVVALSLGILTDAFSALAVIIREVLESVINVFTGLSVNWLLHFPQSYKTRRKPNEIMYDLGMAYVDKKDANRPITVQQTFGVALVGLWSLPNIEQLREKWGQVKRLFSGIGSEFNELNPSGIEIPKSNVNLAETGYLVQVVGPALLYYYEDHDGRTFGNTYFNLAPGTIPIDKVNSFLERNRLEQLRFLKSIPIASYMDLIQVESQIEYEEDGERTHFLQHFFYFGGFSSEEDAERAVKLLEGYYSYYEEYTEDGYPYYLAKYGHTTDLSIIDNEKYYRVFWKIESSLEQRFIDSEETIKYFFETIRKKLEPLPESTISSRYNQYEEKFGGLQSQLLSEEFYKINTTSKYGLVFRAGGSKNYNENEANSLLRTLDLIPYTKYLNFFAISWRNTEEDDFRSHYVLGCFDNYDGLRKTLRPIYERIQMFYQGQGVTKFVLEDYDLETFEWSYISILDFRGNLEPGTQVKLIRKAIPYTDKVSMSGQAPDFNGKLALTDFYYIRDLVFKLSNLAINIEKRRANADKFKSLIQATESRIQRIADTAQQINRDLNSMLAWFFIGDGAKLMTCMGTGSDQDFANALINAPLHPNYPNSDLFEENQNQSKRKDPLSAITQESVNNNLFSGAFLIHLSVSDPRADYENLKKFIDLFMRVTDTEEISNKLQPLEDRIKV